MNPYNFSVLFFGFGAFIVSLFVLLKRKDKITKAYFIFTFFVTLWSICWSIMVSDNVSYDVALLSSRLSHGIGGLAGITWFHSCLVLSDKFSRYKKLLYLFYLLSFISILFFFTPLFVPKVIPIMTFKHYTQTGPILDFYMAIFIINVGLAFIILNKKIQNSNGEEKIQLQGLFAATFIGFFGGFCTILPIYGFNIPPYLLLVMPVYPFMMTYFMSRHRLFDIEQAIQAFQREKLATIGLLAASVNHEIRNPLYAAKGVLDNYMEFAADGIKQKDPIEAIQKASVQIERALDVIGKLNRFAKPTNEIVASNAQASIPEAIQTVLDLVSHEFELDKIQIKNNISEPLPKVKADQRHLEEIFFNLIVNACHAMGKQGGELVIASERSERSNLKAGIALAMFGSLPRNDGFIRITIQDTGSGISAEQSKHLFEPFHTTKGENGTGLGLYVTKQLVERNGGKIEVSSKPGYGSTFTISLPK